MSNVLVIGGTGFAGSHIAKEAADRGHTVTVLSRSSAEHRIDAVRYVQGSAEDHELLDTLLSENDVVVAATSPRGNMAGKVAPLYESIAARAASHNVRFVIVGGFSSLRPSADEKRFFESGSVPAEYLDEAVELAGVFDNLKAHGPENLNWVFISPASTFGAYATVQDYGTYRESNDVALFDDNGDSGISGADFALGVVDEIEKNAHNRENISFVH